MDDESYSSGGFMFVNFDARTKGQGPEDPMRSMKRAHVTKQHYRNVRRQRMEVGSSSSGESSIESPEGIPITTVSFKKKPRSQLSRSAQVSHQLQRDNRRTHEDLNQSQIVKYRTDEDFCYQDVLSSPHSILGQGRLDPFKLFPAEDVPVLVQKLLDHGLNHYWIDLSALDANGDLNPVHKKWMIAARTSPVVFYAFLHAISNHHDFINRSWDTGSSTALMRLSYKTQTIKLVNEMLSNLDKEVPDELLAAVLVLASQGPRVDTGEKSRFRSPLATAQCLDHQGNLAFEPEHARGMVALVRLKGGLHKIKMLGIADIIFYVEIIAATLSLTKPQLPLMFPPRSLPGSGKHKRDKPAMELAQQLGSGFRNLHPLCLIEELWDVIEAMCEVTVAVDHYHRGGPSAPGMPEIVVARNNTQHRLLSLPEYPLQPHSQANYMYEICRVAALTYSNIVIFPLPPATGVHTSLVLRLRQLLTTATSSCSEAHLHVILWAITLGGISSTSSSDRIWFLYKFAEVSSRLELYQWSRIQECLSSLLWLEFVCEKEGVQLWLGARDLIHHDHKVVYPETKN